MVRPVLIGGVGFFTERTGQAEVEDLDLARGRYLHVGRFQVAMDDALLVGLFETAGDLARDVARFLDRQGAPFNDRREVLALAQLHHQADLPFGALDAVDGGDVRVLQRGQGLGLALEAGEAFGVFCKRGGEDLQRHVPSELRVGGAVHGAHATGADLILDAEMCQHGARLHGFSA